mmetsp:Transcript_33660/g.81457  ORF Transcript_33660/g.81457 Transcript_33660/m.81457 type:complete len:248 (+) Transcript_33660:625-1368(+)
MTDWPASAPESMTTLTAVAAVASLSTFEILEMSRVNSLAFVAGMSKKVAKPSSFEITIVWPGHAGSGARKASEDPLSNTTCLVTFLDTILAKSFVKSYSTPETRPVGRGLLIVQRSAALARQSLAFVSSKASYKLPCLSPTLTWGSRAHSLITFSGTPAFSKGAPNTSLDASMFSQFMRSASPSKGEAEAWIALLPVSGLALNPSSSHFANTAPRNESAGASDGSVGPQTLPRKSAHESLPSSHSTT